MRFAIAFFVAGIMGLTLLAGAAEAYRPFLASPYDACRNVKGVQAVFDVGARPTAKYRYIGKRSDRMCQSKKRVNKVK